MKTKKLILEILEDKSELESSAIMREMEERGRSISYDTLSRNLRSMAEEGLLIREAKGKPWNYYYQLNK